MWHSNRLPDRRRTSCKPFTVMTWKLWWSMNSLWNVPVLRSAWPIHHPAWDMCCAGLQNQTTTQNKPTSQPTVHIREQVCGSLARCWRQSCCFRLFVAVFVAWCLLDIVYYYLLSIMVADNGLWLFVVVCGCLRQFARVSVSDGVSRCVPSYKWNSCF